MQHPISQTVVVRFFDALQILKKNKVIRGKGTFTRRYEINRWTLNNVEKNPASGMFQIAWLVFLVEGYGVSPVWLLTGKGEVFTIKKRKNDQKVLSISPGQNFGEEGSEASLSGEVGREHCGVLSGV